MPPRYAYWTILVDEQPTAFRAAMQDDLMPTFKRLQQKHPSAKMMWFQNGKLWNSRLDAQEAMHARGEMGRRGDVRQRKQERPGTKLDWKPRSSQGPRTPRPQGPRTPRPQDPRTPRPQDPRKLEWKPRGSESRARTPSPHDARTPGAPKRKWLPKEEHTRSQAPKSQARRDKNWRPGGEHKDPRQKYKDAKKAKWTRYKQTIRKRWESKQDRKKGR